MLLGTTDDAADVVRELFRVALDKLFLLEYYIRNEFRYNHPLHKTVTRFTRAKGIGRTGGAIRGVPITITVICSDQIKTEVDNAVQYTMRPGAQSPKVVSSNSIPAAVLRVCGRFYFAEPRNRRTHSVHSKTLRRTRY